uniref:Uncharacterized protein n=1 Tax=viral metagenome TaxID=1070528 RepID=A0A6M3MAM2_9ZZZZ
MKEIIIIMGIAPCLEEDLSNIFKLQDLKEVDFMAIGLDCSDRVLFDIQHVTSYHQEFEQFKARRSKAGGNLDYKTHSHKPPADYIWPLVARSPLSGSSAFLGCQAAIGLGYEKIVLCGCPMQGKNFINKKATDYDKFQKGWVKFAPQMFGDKVKSMSGFTRDLMGFPTKEWLYE